MLQKFEKHIHTNFPFIRDSKLLLAISGGLDSVVLMHLCNQLKLNISLAHCNFKLRNEESDLDEEFVKKIAQYIHDENVQMEHLTQQQNFLMDSMLLQDLAYLQ